MALAPFAQAAKPAFGADLAGFLARDFLFATLALFARFGLAVAAGPGAQARFGSLARALSRAMARATAFASTPGCSKQKPAAASRTMPISTPDATGSTRPRRGRGGAPSNAPMALTISRPSSSMMIVA
jgi:hypothetical protein